MGYRKDKLENLIKEELSLIFLHRLSDPVFGFLTITGVKLSPDLKIAKVFISVFDKDKRETTLQKVLAKTGFIRSELASKIRVRYVPELKFFIDETLDYVEKIEGLLKKIHEDDNKTIE
jgi:ribosome-binding factor A